MSYKVGNNVIIGNNVVINNDVVVGNNVTIFDNVIIGKETIIGDNTTIGYLDTESPTKTTVTEIGENAKIRSGSVIYNGTKIGANSKIGHNTVIRERTIIGHDTYIGSLTAIEGDTKIGNHVGIHSQVHITKYCNIGDYTFIAPMFVGANDQAMSHKRRGHGQNLIGFTTEKYVRIAIGVTVLPGVNFGEGCIVGSGSVVTKDVPPYKFTIGIPARVIKDAPKEEIVL
ncbi:DapH/DapD/GlmU-related protein [Chloroflexota bacterium]